MSKVEECIEPHDEHDEDNGDHDGNDENYHDDQCFQI